MINIADKSIHYDGSAVLGYQALINFIVAMRGFGKSYFYKKRALKLFIEEGVQFAYIRRYKGELKDSMDKFFDDLLVNNEFPDRIFEVEDGEFYVDGMVAGYGLALSTQAKKKSVSFPRVGMMIFDEFMLDPDNNVVDRYLPNEPDKLMNLIETIGRDRDVPIYLLGNSFTWNNPYFIFFNVKKPYNKNNIRCEHDVLIEVADGKLFKQHKENTRYGKILANTKTGRHIIENEFVNDNDSFICKPFDRMRYFFTIKAGGKMYGVYHVEERGVYYVSDVYDPNYKRLIYTPILEDHEPNMILLKSSNSPPWKSFVKAFKFGGVWYCNGKVKTVIFECMKGGL